MQRAEILSSNRRICPVRKHLAWWQDWEFTNDLLLHPQRPILEEVCITAGADCETFETVVEIRCLVRNRLDTDLPCAKIHAVIIDEFGIVMNRPNTRIWTRVTDLAAHDTQVAQLIWQQECPAQSYHLVLRLEDTHGNLIDVVSGDFVIG